MTRRDVLTGGLVLMATTGVEAAERERDPLADLYRGGDAPAKASVRDLRRALEGARTVFVGEMHDDPITHRAELRLLEEAHRLHGDRLTLAMEMFERDQQSVLSDYLAGRLSEAEMGKRIKLWGNYPTDYRPLVEYAKKNRVPVVGSNAPAGIVRRVGREGLAAVLPSLTPEERRQIAASVIAPADTADEYARRFASVIGAGHGDGKGMDPAMVRRFFEAQCLRDDTMAESVARELDAGRTVLHVNGGFHSDAGLGTVQRLLWRRPLLAACVVTVKCVPYRGKIDPAAEKGEADWLVYVPDTRPEQKPGGGE